MTRRFTMFLGLAFVLAFPPALARPAEGDESDSSVERREDEMFGDDAESSKEEEQRLEARLEEESDPLQLGGTYFNRLQYTILEEGEPQTFPVALQNIADLYVDARPTSRIRFYTEARLQFAPTVDPAETDALGRTPTRLSLDLDQLWLKFDLARTVYVTIGRQHLRWGVGRFWHPNDFLFAQKRDPLAVFDNRTGVDLVKFHVPFEKLGWNFYAVAQVDSADSFEDFGAGARMEFLFDRTEVAAAGTIRKKAPLQLGIDVSTGVGPFDLWGAGSVVYSDPTTYYEGDFDANSLSNSDPRRWVLPEPYSREDEWMFRALAGAELGLRIFDDDTLLLGAEYFFNDPGYDNEDLYPWLLLQGEFRPFYVGRHYAGLYAALPSPGRLDDMSFTFSTLSNLSDGSFLSRFDYRLTMLTRLQFYAFATLQYGSRGEFNLRIDIPEIDAPGVPSALADGATVPAVRARLGVGLQLDF